MALSSSQSCPKCGDNHKGKPFAVYPDGYHCFSCGAHKSADRSLGEIIQKPVAENVSLPEGLEYNPNRFTVTSQQWLLQYHLTHEQITRHQIAEADGPSVILPVIVDGEIVKYTRRWMGQRRFYAEGEGRMIVSPEQSNTLVLVEDYISCIRVGEIVNCMCLHGTTMKREDMQHVLSTYDNIVVWLDNDTGRSDNRNPGQENAQKIISRLERMVYYKYSLSDKQVINIVSGKDPKYYTNSQIRKIINEFCLSPRQHCL